jgi:hypothetical protein
VIVGRRLRLEIGKAFMRDLLDEDLFGRHLDRDLFGRHLDRDLFGWDLRGTIRLGRAYIGLGLGDRSRLGLHLQHVTGRWTFGFRRRILRFLLGGFDLL